LCEKPLAASSTDAQALVEAAAASSGVLAAGMLRRFFPATQAIRELLHAGTLGEIVSLDIQEGNQFRWPAASPEYFTKRSSAGGVLMDIGAHALDLMVWWLGEPAELAGMTKSEVEKIKAFITRTHDRARGAYKYFKVEAPRRCVFIATTNESEYLKSQTGNRRFWPVRVGNIDIDRLRSERDQLWAEAVLIERSGIPLILPDELWAAAAAERVTAKARTAPAEKLSPAPQMSTGFWIRFVLTWLGCPLPSNSSTPSDPPVTISSGAFVCSFSAG